MNNTKLYQSVIKVDHLVSYQWPIELGRDEGWEVTWIKESTAPLHILADSFP
jgi:hypothetical protein